MKMIFEAITATLLPISRRSEMMLSVECHMDHDQAMNALKAIRDAMAPATWEAMIYEVNKEISDDIAAFPIPANPDEEAQWQRDRAQLVREGNALLEFEAWASEK